MASADRKIELDVLRIVAVFLVLGRHNILPPAYAPELIKTIGTLWFQGGWIGVDLFFVLSGFLVSGLLFNEYAATGNISPLRFYVRRGFKIYPVFYVFIVLTLLVFDGEARLSLLFSELLFLQSYLPSLWNHTWSLAVEEHFYILLPLFMLAFARRGMLASRGFIVAITLILVATLAGRCLTYLSAEGFHYYTHFFPSHLRFDSLFFGVLMAYGYHFHRQKVFPDGKGRALMAITCGVALLVPFFFLTIGKHAYIHTVGFSVAYLGAGLILWGLTVISLPDSLFLRSLAYLGSRSYSIYICHMFVKVWGMNQFTRFGIELNYIEFSVVYMGGSVLMGLVLATAVEYPVLKLRNRLFPASGQTLSIS